ncbi:hypothetical protein D3C73_1618860 [compost metagenome]
MKGRIGELFIAAVPHFFRIVSAEPLLDSKMALQLQMTPVIERIARQLRHSAGPGFEFGQIVALPGN